MRKYIGEHAFPEHVEEEEVERDEGPHHAGFEQEEQRHVPADLLLDPEGADDREERQQGRQEDHGHGDPVGAHEVLHVDVGDPHVFFHELERVRGVDAGQGPVEGVEQLDCQQDGKEGSHRRDPLDHRVLPLGHAQDQHGPEEGDERHQRKNMGIDEIHEEIPPFL
jgi:hypothetical protein